MKTLWAKISLQRVFSLFTFVTVAFLLIILFLAGKQYFLFRHCEQRVAASQHLLFHFTGIKEHINVSLMQQKKLQPSIIDEIQSLDDQLGLIINDILIPEEYKLNFINQLDLVELTVIIRNLQNAQFTKNTQHVKLTEQLQEINSKLTSFHQLLTRYTQKQLLDLHRALVGLFAVIIALVSMMLLIINRYITSPVIQHCKRLFPDEEKAISLFSLHKTIENMAALPETKSHQFDHQNSSELSRLYRNSSVGNLLGGLSNELINRSNGILNYTQAILDLSPDLLLDNDAKHLLEKLYGEEKKMAELLVRMIQFTSTTKEGIPQHLSIHAFFAHILALIQETLKNDKIELLLHLDDPEQTLNYHVSDLQLVILSAIQSSRVALKAKSNPKNEKKQIVISLDSEQLLQNKVVFSIKDHGAPWKVVLKDNSTGTKRPWHNMTFCHDFIQLFGGSINVTQEADQSNLCVITMPFRKETR